jgi:peptidoglycan/xylan/chitin deacetylase (PgdA/CDA1 family)
MTRIRQLLRQTAYRSGGLGLISEKLRGALRMVTFHRVIDPGDPDFAGVDPEDTVSAPFFEEPLAFFEDHYNPIGLAALMAAAERGQQLPDHALLISLDDGWLDNLRYAAPLLKSRGLRAVIFIPAERVLSSAEL